MKLAFNIIAVDMIIPFSCAHFCPLQLGTDFSKCGYCIKINFLL